MPAALITGATGFVGSALCAALAKAGHQVRGAVRQVPPHPFDTLRAGSSPLPQGERGLLDVMGVGDIGPETDWSMALAGVDVVVHLAARVHVMSETARDPLTEYRRVNTAGTERLARAAAQAGAKRLVFLSTIKVNGERTGCPPHPLRRYSGQAPGERERFSETDVPNPQDAYAQSKWEAEQALQRIVAETGLEVVALRAPLVYGPGVKGNFLRLLEAVHRGVPLPLASVNNRRSFIFLGNLVDAIIICLTHPEAQGKTYMVSDGEDVSTAELISRIAQALGKPTRLWPFPPALLRLAGSLTGKSDEVNRLLGSLQIDSTRICRELGWKPPYSMAQGLAETARWYLASLRASG